MSSISNNRTKKQKDDSKFSAENIDESLKNKLVDAKYSFSVAQSLDPNPEIIKFYKNKFNDPELDCKSRFFKDDKFNLKRGNYDRLFYKTSDFCPKLNDLIYDPKSTAPPKTIIIIEQDECYINHVKTIAGVIQFCLTALTYALNGKMKDHKQFVLSDLACVPGFYMKILDNGIIDFENSNFVNNADGLVIDRNLELFNFNFKMLVEGYSSPDIKCRQLTANQKRRRDVLINKFLLNEEDREDLTFWKFRVYKNGKKTSHTVEFRPVVKYRHISKVVDLLQLICDFHLSQGIVYNYVGQFTGLVCNPEHGNSKNPAYLIGKEAYYEICYLIDDYGFPVEIDYEDRDEFDFDDHRHKFVTESRHYGGDVQATLNGTTATFGTGNKFDILLIK